MSKFMLRVLGRAQDSVTRLTYGVESGPVPMSFYECTDRLMDGTEVKMSDYKGQVLLLVNVASK